MAGLAHAMFRRSTDRVVGSLYRQPLDVGADRIARAAHAALEFLWVLGGTNGPIPLAWTPGEVSTISAIEVYPAATLISHIGKTRVNELGDYRKDEEIEKRRKLLHWLDGAGIEIGRCADEASKTEHTLDAVACVLAGADFLRSQVFRPDDFKLDESVIRQEGWIWVRRPLAG
jgi:hypothetical protein